MQTRGYNHVIERTDTRECLGRDVRWTHPRLNLALCVKRKMRKLAWNADPKGWSGQTTRVKASRVHQWVTEARNATAPWNATTKGTRNETARSEMSMSFAGYATPAPRNASASDAGGA